MPISPLQRRRSGERSSSARVVAASRWSLVPATSPVSPAWIAMPQRAVHSAPRSPAAVAKLKACFPCSLAASLGPRQMASDWSAWCTRESRRGSEPLVVAREGVVVSAAPERGHAEAPLERRDTTLVAPCVREGDGPLPVGGGPRVVAQALPRPRQQVEQRLTCGGVVQALGQRERGLQRLRRLAVGPALQRRLPGRGQVKAGARG